LDLDQGGEEEMEFSITNTDMKGVVRDEPHRQASYLHTLESINAHLFAEVLVLCEHEERIAILKKGCHTLESKVQVIDEVRDGIVRLEAELDVGKPQRYGLSLFYLSFTFTFTILFTQKVYPKSTATTSTATPHIHRHPNISNQNAHPTLCMPSSSKHMGSPPSSCGTVSLRLRPLRTLSGRPRTPSCAWRPRRASPWIE
jgi:hypothetical protein